MKDYEFKLPKKGDKLFLNCGPDWENNAHLDFSTYHALSQGYKELADIAIDRILDSHIRDWWAYPIVYCYRHSIELKIKEAITNGNKLLEDDPSVRKEHNLRTLWNTCRPIFENIYANSPTDDLDIVEEIILEFHEVDPNGQTFRYPVNLDGNPWDYNQDKINLRNLKEKMEGLFNFLNSTTSGISDYLDAKED